MQQAERLSASSSGCEDAHHVRCVRGGGSGLAASVLALNCSRALRHIFSRSRCFVSPGTARGEERCGFGFTCRSNLSCHGCRYGTEHEHETAFVEARMPQRSWRAPPSTFTVILLRFSSKPAKRKSVPRSGFIRILQY